MEVKQPDYKIQAVTNALKVLEVFLEEKGELGISELSRHLGLYKNHVFRILVTLAASGYVEKNQKTDLYRLGIKALKLGKAFNKHTALVNITLPYLKNLTEEVNENSSFGILKDNLVYYLQEIQAPQILSVTSLLGTTVSPLCSAIGKMILANINENQQNLIIKKNEFISYTNNTIINKKNFQKELKKIYDQQYAIDHEEFVMGLMCIAAPVKNYEGETVGAVSIVGPICRLDLPDKQPFFINAVMDCAQKISKVLGFS